MIDKGARIAFTAHVRSNRRSLVALLVVSLCLLLPACFWNDDNSWRTGEVAWELEDLEGPPSAPASYRGSIGPRLYFQHTSHNTTDNGHNPIVYDPSTGWNVAPEPFDELASAGGYLDHIVAAGDYHFVFDVGSGDVYRSEDEGESWEEVSSLSRQARGLGSDGERLFVYESDDNTFSSSGLLWRSDTEGQNWEIIRDDLIDRNRFRVAEGMVTACVQSGSQLAALDYSVDGGETWERVEPDELPHRCEEMLGKRYWKRSGGRFLMAPELGSPTSSMLGVVDDPGLVQWRELQGVDDSDTLGEVEVCGGQVFALVRRHQDDSNSSPWRLGRINDALERWEPIDELPYAAKARVRSQVTSLYCSADEHLVVRTDVGLWQSSDDGRSWEQMAPKMSLAQFAFEFGGTLYSGELSRVPWRYEQDQWVPARLPTPLEDQRLYQAVDDGTYLYTRASTAEGYGLYRVDMAAGQSEQLWSVAVSDEQRISLEFAADADDIAIWSRQSGLEDGEFVERAEFAISRDAGQSFETFPVATEEDAGPSGISSIAIHGGHAWVIDHDGRHHRASLDDLEWEVAGEGIDPEASRLRLHTADGELLSFGRRVIYVWEDGQWRDVSSGRLRDELMLEPIGASWVGEYITDATVRDGQLVVATTSEVVFLDRQRRTLKIFEPEDIGRDIEYVHSLSSGVYIAYENGGLHRILWD